MTEQVVSAARQREFWENLAAKPIKYTEYELSDEHIRSLQSSHDLPEATPMRRVHFDAWLAEHDRRTLAETQKRIDDAIAYLSDRSFSNGVVPKALAILRGEDA